MAMTNPDPVSDLRAKIAELESMDLGKLAARAALFPARINLEDAAEGLAEEYGTDEDLVLLVAGAAWAVRLGVETSGEDTPDPEGFAGRVELDLRGALTALGDGVTETGNPEIDRVLERAVSLGKSGVKITPVREILAVARDMIADGP